MSLFNPQTTPKKKTGKEVTPIEEPVSQEQPQEETFIVTPKIADAPLVVEPAPITYAHDDLIRGLFWIWDAFDTALMNFFVVGDTAKAILDKTLLDGDKITVGTRWLEWNAGSKSIFYAFTGEPVETKDNCFIFKNPFNNIRVWVYVFDDNEYIRAPDTVFYQSEYFKVPNPYTVFSEKYNIWK